MTLNAAHSEAPSYLPLFLICALNTHARLLDRAGTRSSLRETLRFSPGEDSGGMWVQGPRPCSVKIARHSGLRWCRRKTPAIIMSRCTVY